MPMTGLQGAEGAMLSREMLNFAAASQLLPPRRVGATPGELGGLSRCTRLVLRLDRVLADEAPSLLWPLGSAVALFEVWAEPVQEMQVRFGQAHE